MTQPSNIKLKAVTLNCWGLYHPLSQLKPERMQAIGEALSHGEYDVVLLQEIWVESDYNKLVAITAEVLPYTHYFHSGYLGSGVCILSKHPIIGTFIHQYTLNGMAHRITHGDWWAAKAVGLAQLDCKGFRVNAYVTHTHAGYGSYDYKVHKTAQAFELGRFVRLTSDGCDAVIVGGDFNAEPHQLTFKLPLVQGGLKDAWTSQVAKYQEEEGVTACYKVWPFNESGEVMNPIKGGRIDYLLYRNNAGIDMTCDRCYTTLKQVPDKAYFYSDHIAVAADFTIKRSVTSMASAVGEGDETELITEAVTVMEAGITQAKAYRVYYIVALVLSYLALSFSSNLDLPYGFSFISVFIQLVLLFTFAYCTWMAVITHCWEVSALTAVRSDLKHLQARLYAQWQRKYQDGLR